MTCVEVSPCACRYRYVFLNPPRLTEKLRTEVHVAGVLAPLNVLVHFLQLVRISEEGLLKLILTLCRNTNEAATGCAEDRSEKSNREHRRSWLDRTSLACHSQPF